jgi:hypothetical protein
VGDRLSEPVGFRVLDVEAKVSIFLQDFLPFFIIARQSEPRFRLGRFL